MRSAEKKRRVRWERSKVRQTKRVLGWHRRRWIEASLWNYIADRWGFGKDGTVEG